MPPRVVVDVSLKSLSSINRNGKILGMQRTRTIVRSSDRTVRIRVRFESLSSGSVSEFGFGLRVRVRVRVRALAHFRTDKMLNYS